MQSAELNLDGVRFADGAAREDGLAPGGRTGDEEEEEEGAPGASPAVLASTPLGPSPRGEMVPSTPAKAGSFLEDLIFRQSRRARARRADASNGATKITVMAEALSGALVLDLSRSLSRGHSPPGSEVRAAGVSTPILPSATERAIVTDSPCSRMHYL